MEQDDMVSSILGRALTNAAQSLYDDYVKANASFRSGAGLKAKLIRTMHGHGCPWCRKLAGTYDYDDAPADIYRRHDNCSCTVTYVTEKGYQDVHSKKYVTDPKEIERRENIGIDESKRFKPSTNIESAQKYASQFVGKGYSPKFKNIVDYKGISIENANEINRALKDAYTKNGTMPLLNGIKSVSPTSSLGKKIFTSVDAVAAYNPVEHGIYLNKDILNSYTNVEKYANESKKAWRIVMSNIDSLSGEQRALAEIYKTAGRSTVGDGSVYDYIIHELGHHNAWEVLDTKTSNELRTRMSLFATKISGYANANADEYLAESYAAYIKGNHSKLDPIFSDFMDNLINNPLHSKNDIIDVTDEFVRNSTSVIPALHLEKNEYAHVISELNTNLTKDELRTPIVSRAIDSYVYTFECHGFNDYRIIGKKAITTKVKV